MLRAVLDANVYASAALHPSGPPGEIIERFVRDSAFEIILSPAIVSEVFRVLTYPKLRKAVGHPEELRGWFEGIVLLSDVVSGDYRLAGVSKDPDDDQYIAAALEGRAAFVVTGDQHLLALREYEGVRIVTPRFFLEFISS